MPWHNLDAKLIEDGVLQWEFYVVVAIPILATLTACFWAAWDGEGIESSVMFALVVGILTLLGCGIVAMFPGIVAITVAALGLLAGVAVLGKLFRGC